MTIDQPLSWDHYSNPPHKNFTKTSIFSHEVAWRAVCGRQVIISFSEQYGLCSWPIWPRSEKRHDQHDTSSHCPSGRWAGRKGPVLNFEGQVGGRGPVQLNWVVICWTSSRSTAVKDWIGIFQINADEDFQVQRLHHSFGKWWHNNFIERWASAKTQWMCWRLATRCWRRGGRWSARPSTRDCSRSTPRLPSSPWLSYWVNSLQRGRIRLREMIHVKPSQRMQDSKN